MKTIFPVLLFLGLTAGLCTPVARAAGNQCAPALCPPPPIGAAPPIVVPESNGVPGLQCPGCVAGRYTLGPDAWQDAMRVIFAGVHHDGSTDCNSDVRRALADQWHTLFPTTCSSGRCSGLSHAWRAGDGAMETASFLAQLGLGAASTNPFCNGGGTTLGMGLATPAVSDILDLDPFGEPAAPTNRSAAGTAPWAW